MADKLFIIDPNSSANNPFGESVVTPEHLSISVELRTYKKDRSAISIAKDKSIVKTGSQAVPITFIGGSDLGDGQKTLTTHYTEVNTAFNKEHKDLETLGIKDINIEFNSSRAPLIVINFIDARGKLFEMGKQSPYSVFYELPYPIFELTIKGYYGKAVKYRLHLTKFNGRFDYSTGSFEIQCEFIGYTYAFLSDIIMGHLKGIPYTEKGKAKADAKRAQANQGAHQFMTFKELNSIVKSIDGKVDKIKQDNPQLKALKKSGEIIELLKQFRASLDTNLSAIGSARNVKLVSNAGFYPLKSTDTGFGQQGANIANVNIANVTNDAGVKELNAEINNFNKLVTEYLNTLNGAGMLDNGYKLSEYNYFIVDKINLYKRVVRNDFKGFVEDYITATKGTTKYISSLSDKTKYDAFKKNVENVREVGEFIEFFVIDFSDAFNEIDALIKRLNDEAKTTIPVLSEVVLDSELFTYDGKYFQPTIGNLVNLICDHVDIFMEVVREVALDAEKDATQRAKDLQGLGDNLDIIDGELGNLKAFPSYSELENGIMVDKWIGNVAPNIPEVIFINDLLEGILKAEKDDRGTLEDLASNEGESQWFPINAFDSIITNVVNPYRKFADTAKVNDYLRIIALRAIIYLGYSNKHNTNGDITIMAKLEANNVYNEIINKDIRAAIKSYANDGATSTSKLIQALKGDVFENFKRNYKYTPDPLLNPAPIIGAIQTGPRNYISNVIRENGDEYLYEYMPFPDASNELNFRFQVIPLTVAGSYSEYDGNDLSIAQDEDRIILRDSDGVILFSDVVGAANTLYKGDDGATTIKILKDRSYVEGKINYPSYGSDIDTKIKTIDINQEVIDAGPTNCFFKVNYDGNQDMSTAYLFYSKVQRSQFNRFTKLRDNSSEKLETRYDMTANLSNQDLNINTSVLVNRRDNKASTMGTLHGGASVDSCSFPFLGFSTRKSGVDFFQSLFGSDLYYQQTDKKAKAYLFLHSIPFDGLGNTLSASALFNGNNSIDKLFNQKSGFIETSYSWVLFVGALISRMNKEFIVRYGNSQMSYIPYVKRVSIPSENEFACYSGGDFHSYANSDYYAIDQIIQSLPDSTKKIFLAEFNTWIEDGDFDMIRSEYELFVDGVSQNQRYNFWNTFNTRVKSDQEGLFNDPILNPKVKSNYNVLLKNTGDFKEGSTIQSILNTVSANDTGSPFNFYLEAKDKSELVRQTISFLMEKRVIANSTWRIWINDGDDGDEPVINVNPIKTKKDDLENYLTAFFTEFIKISVDGDLVNSSEGDTVKENIFKSIDNDDIRLNLYKKIKSLYDKWICGEEELYVGINGDELYNSFKFIDRAYNNIEDRFKVNLIPMVTQLTGNYNQNFYNYLARILGDNNFDFIPLPTFINYNDPVAVGEVFKPYTYNTAPEAFGPQFICMYIGERSNVLDYGGNFKNDGFDFGIDEPSDFKVGISEDEKSQFSRVPVFNVDYGKDTQSIFKDIQLNQNEFTATDESLTITDALSNSVTSQGMGQNLYDIHINRSYTAHVEMLGNAMIQPLMHFQLNGVPIFHGAYTVIKVKHAIKPNTMTTSFSGVRIRKPMTKMIDDTTIFMNMFNGLEGVTSGDANLNDLITSDERGVIETSTYSNFVTYKFNEGGNKPGLAKQAGDVKEYCIREVGEFIEYVANLWHTQSINEAYADKLHYNDLSRRGGGQLGSHKSHKEGTSIDIQQITTDKTVRKVEVGNSHYDQAATIKLIQLFVDSQKNYKGWAGNKIIKEIFFDDPVIVNKFSGLVKSIGGHRNHLHIEFNVPNRVNESISNGDVTSNIDPTVVGQLKKLDKRLIPTNNQRLEFLGKI